MIECGSKSTKSTKSTKTTNSLTNSHKHMSRTDSGVTESYKNFEDFLEEYEDDVIKRNGSLNITPYSLRRYVLDDMYRDSLLNPYVYMELHKKNSEKERSQIWNDTIYYMIFCATIYLCMRIEHSLFY